MTRKRFIKLNMALGWSRNESEREAEYARRIGTYQGEYDEIMELFEMLRGCTDE